MSSNSNDKDEAERNEDGSCIGALCWVKAPNSGGEVAINQEMPEMRPFPGCIAELDGYTYTGVE